MQEQTSIYMSPPRLSAPAKLNAVARQGLEGELRAGTEVPFNVNLKTAVGGTNVDMLLN